MNKISKDMTEKLARSVDHRKLFYVSPKDRVEKLRLIGNLGYIVENSQFLTYKYGNSRKLARVVSRW